MAMTEVLPSPVGRSSAERFAPSRKLWNSRTCHGNGGLPVISSKAAAKSAGAAPPRVNILPLRKLPSRSFNSRGAMRYRAIGHFLSSHEGWGSRNAQQPIQDPTPHRSLVELPHHIDRNSFDIRSAAWTCNPFAAL